MISTNYYEKWSTFKGHKQSHVFTLQKQYHLKNCASCRLFSNNRPLTGPSNSSNCDNLKCNWRSLVNCKPFQISNGMFSICVHQLTRFWLTSMSHGLSAIPELLVKYVIPSLLQLEDFGQLHVSLLWLTLLLHKQASIRCFSAFPSTFSWWISKLTVFFSSFSVCRSPASSCFMKSYSIRGITTNNDWELPPQSIGTSLASDVDTASCVCCDDDA